MKATTASLLAVLVTACTNPTDEPDCDPAGKWEVTITAQGEGCHESGASQTMPLDISSSEAKAIDPDRCGGETEIPYEEPETEDSYGLEGELRLELTFGDERLTGSAQLRADITESGEAIDACTQQFKLTGKRK